MKHETKSKQDIPVINPQLLARACIKYKYYMYKYSDGCYTLTSSIKNSIVPVIIMVENYAGKVKVTPKLGSDYRYTPSFCITTFEQIKDLKADLKRAKQDAKLIEKELLLPSIIRNRTKVGTSYKVTAVCPHCGQVVSNSSIKCPHCNKEYYNSAKNVPIHNKLMLLTEREFKDK